MALGRGAGPSRCASLRGVACEDIGHRGYPSPDAAPHSQHGARQDQMRVLRPTRFKPIHGTGRFNSHTQRNSRKKAPIGVGDFGQDHRR